MKKKIIFPSLVFYDFYRTDFHEVPRTLRGDIYRILPRSVDKYEK